MKKRIISIASPWHIRQSLSTTKKTILQISGILTILLLYSIVCYRVHRPEPLGNPNDTTTPTLSQFIEGFQEIIRPRSHNERWLISDIQKTFGRLAWGMSISCVISVVLGISMGCYRAIESYFGLIISAMAKEPATAMFAAFFVLLGTGEWLYTGMVVFGTLPWMTQAIYDSIHNDVHKNLVYKMITFSASPAEQVYNLVYKQVLPRIIDFIRIATSAAMIGLLAAEMQVGYGGFGYRIKISSHRLDMSVVYLYLATLVLIGYLIDYAFDRFRDYWCPWHGEEPVKFSGISPKSIVAKITALLFLGIWS